MPRRCTTSSSSPSTAFDRTTQTRWDHPSAGPRQGGRLGSQGHARPATLRSPSPTTTRSSPASIRNTTDWSPTASTTRPRMRGTPWLTSHRERWRLVRRHSTVEFGGEPGHAHGHHVLGRLRSQNRRLPPTWYAQYDNEDRGFRRSGSGTNRRRRCTCSSFHRRTALTLITSITPSLTTKATSSAPMLRKPKQQPSRWMGLSAS